MRVEININRAYSVEQWDGRFLYEILFGVQRRQSYRRVSPYRAQSVDPSNRNYKITIYTDR